jgi:hypothetical protein
LWDTPSFVNLGRFDAPGNDDLPSLRVFGGYELGNCFRGQHPSVRLIVMSYPDLFLVGNSEVDCSDWPSIASFQLPQPLVRHIEIPGNGDGEHAARKVADYLAQTPDAISLD